MAWKNLEQTTLADAMQVEHAALKELDDVYELIDWTRVVKILSDIHTSKRGEKSWPPLFMFKALLLQSWYALSDPALEKQLARDLLFRRFIGLRHRGVSPRSFNDQLTEQDLYINSGQISIIDASVIEAKQCRPNKKKDLSSTQDPEAGWKVKVASDGKSKSTYGNKAHLNVDEDGLVKAMDYTAGNVHDSNRFTRLLMVMKCVFMQIVLIKGTCIANGYQSMVSRIV
jgi:IS5 family transposase